MQERADGQLSMFSLFRPEPVRRAVDPQGMVISGRVHTVLRLANPKEPDWDIARVEIHPYDGRWMWATAFSIDGQGGNGYRVGPKWGKFAATMEDAIYWAVQELQAAIAKYARSKHRDEIERWLALYEPINWQPRSDQPGRAASAAKGAQKSPI